MNIPICKDWSLQSDDHNFILVETSVATKDGVTGNPYDKTRKFYQTIKAVIRYVKNNVNAKAATTAWKALASASKELNSALRSLPVKPSNQDIFFTPQLKLVLDSSSGYYTLFEVRVVSAESKKSKAENVGKEYLVPVTFPSTLASAIVRCCQLCLRQSEAVTLAQLAEDYASVTNLVKKVRKDLEEPK